MSTTAPLRTDGRTPTTTRWRIDPSRSRVEFRTPTLWGLATVKGHFVRYDGTLDLERDPAITLTIDAASLDTHNRLRDRHLRSPDFFDVANHPQVRFVSDSATLDGERLNVRGRLYAGGESIPLDLNARLVQDRRRAGGRRHHDRRSPQARDDPQHARHDSHPHRADGPRATRDGLRLTLSYEQSKQIAEENRDSEWTRSSFGREMYLGRQPMSSGAASASAIAR